MFVLLYIYYLFETSAGLQAQRVFYKFMLSGIFGAKAKKNPLRQNTAKTGRT